MVVFLHQTTTPDRPGKGRPEVYMVVFLHQTTTESLKEFLLSRCIWLFSYIKPQLAEVDELVDDGCIWLFSYIKPQLDEWCVVNLHRCIWLFSYIKPQRGRRNRAHRGGVYGCFPTSNHNIWPPRPSLYAVYMVVFLHQTTTARWSAYWPATVYMVVFLHQTTTSVYVTTS